MKRFFVICIVYLLFLSIPIDAQSTKLKYKLYASESTNLLELKNKVYATLDYLCKDLDEESYSTIVKENLDLFMYEENINVRFYKNTLYIVDSKKGKSIGGTYSKKNVCYEEVNKRSLIKEWWENAQDKE